MKSDWVYGGTVNCFNLPLNEMEGIKWEIKQREQDPQKWSS